MRKTITILSLGLFFLSLEAFGLNEKLHNLQNIQDDQLNAVDKSISSAIQENYFQCNDSIDVNFQKLGNLIVYGNPEL